MRRLLPLLLLCAAAPAGAADRKHLFNSEGALTAASSLAPRAIAADYLRAQGAALELSAEDLAGAYIAKEYRTAHNGVTHFVYRQQFRGMPVANAEWVVNVDRDGRVINAGGRLFARPAPGVDVPEPVTAMAAVREAASAVNPKLAERYLPFQTGGDGVKVSFHRGAFAEEPEGRPVWFGLEGTLRPAWRFSITDEDGATYETVVDAVTRRVLSRECLTWYQNPPRGLVFEKSSPQPNPQPGVRLTAPPPYIQRTLVPFTGDPAASPRGWVAGNATEGNNVVAGPNPEGWDFIVPVPVVSATRDFSFPLELGPGAPNPTQFSEAVTTSLFYWMNKAHDWFYAVGFDEAAGNFQHDNFGRGGMGGDPVWAYSQFGSAAYGRAEVNNAYFSTRSREDGTPSAIAMFLGSANVAGVFTDGSLDPEVVIHEYTHGVSNRLVRDLSGMQGGAMGEGWSDFFAQEFTTPEGAPLDGWFPSAEYFFQSFGAGGRTRPYSTSMETNPLTFAHFGRVLPYPEVHADGEIWASVLWELRAAMIRQWGEKEGRRRVRLLAIDGMKLSPPAPSYVDMRDAILLADRVDFQGASQQQLWEAFAKRGLGVLAYTWGPTTPHVTASFEKPSSTAVMAMSQEKYVLGEVVWVWVYDPNRTSRNATLQFASTSGDVETVQLERTGNLYTGGIWTDSSVSEREDGYLTVIPNDFVGAYYVDHAAGKLVRTSAATSPEYYATIGAPSMPYPNEKALGLRATAGSFALVQLPFEFQFYGRKYQVARVFSNGLISFDMAPDTPCSGTAALASAVAIAPMWMDLKTNGRAQPNEDVYIGRGVDFVSFRWAAETSPMTAYGAQPEPVNFAVVLFDTGRIQLQYGAGNQNLVSNNPYGVPRCSPSSPVVGISNGTEYFARTVGGYHGAANLENARTISYFPQNSPGSLPGAVLEKPAADDVVKGVLRVSGAVWDAADPVTRIDVLVDGVFRGHTTVGVLRADVCEQQGLKPCNARAFDFLLDVAWAKLAPGTHTLTLQAMNARGGITAFPEKPVTFRVEPGQSMLPVAAVESPAAGAEITGRFTVKGWTAAEAMSIYAVDVIIDGINYGEGVLGEPRKDVCAALPFKSPDCPGVGFTATINPSSPVLLPNGPHKLQLRVTDETGRATMLPDQPIAINVNVAPNKPPVGVLVTPKNGDKLSGTVRVYGYAWDPDGKVTSVALIIDGVAYALPYGVERPSECEALEGVAACPKIGFDREFDTRLLRNGAHSFGVRLTDDKGVSVIVPNWNATGINVTVENP